MKIDTQNQKTWCDDDILLTAFLLTDKDVSLIDIKEDKPHHFVFILSNPQKCQDLKRQYLNGASAPARELFFNREMLINEMKNRERNGDKNYGQFCS